MAEAGRPNVLVIDHVAPVTRLLEKRRQMFEVQEALDAQKEEYARREEAARRREEELRRKDLDLQTSLIHYNKSITTNEDKRQRALQRIQAESRALNKKESEVDELSARIAREEERQEERLAAIERVQQYFDFMHAVQVTHSDEFAEMPSIRRRFERLEGTGRDLVVRNRRLAEDLRRSRKALEAARSREITERLAQTLTATEMTGRYEGLVDDTERLARREAEAAVGGHRRVSEFGVVMASVGNLFTRVAASLPGQHIRHFDHEATEREAAEAAEAAAAAQGFTLEALEAASGLLEAQGSQAAAASASSPAGGAASDPASAKAAGSSSPAKTGAGAARAGSRAPSGGRAHGSGKAADRAARAAAAEALSDPGGAAAASLRKAAAIVELERATVSAGLRLEAVGHWLTDLDGLVRAWGRDKHRVLAEERARVRSEADVAARTAAAARSGLAGTISGAGGGGKAGQRSPRKAGGGGSSVGGSDRESARGARASLHSGALGETTARGGGLTGRTAAGRATGRPAQAGERVWHVNTQTSASGFGSFGGDSAAQSVVS